MIVGFSGAGKSTLARRLGERLSIEPTHLDALFWKPGWVESTVEEVVEKLRPILQRERWIVEGAYRKMLYWERMEQCDTLIFLDFNRFLCFYRVVKRRWMYHRKTRPDMGAGCHEKLDLEFAKWVLFEGRKKRKQFYQELAALENKQVCIFRRPRQVEHFLKQAERNEKQ